MFTVLVMFVRNHIYQIVLNIETLHEYCYQANACSVAPDTTGLHN